MKKNVATKILAALLILIALLLIAGFIILNKILTFEPDDNTETGAEVVASVQAEEEDFSVEQLDELMSDSSLSASLKNWSLLTTDANLMRSADVTNILLVGVDKGGSNSDVMMLCSVNRSTKKIYLSSVMRDSYTYMPSSAGDLYGKMNAAYSYGGIGLLIDTFQNNFKIKIDHYATVNFQTFAKIVDIFGGINLTVEPYEAREIDKIIRTTYSTYYDPCPSGENVLLSGVYALTFCRIRHCYSNADVHRTLNQRKFISAVIDRSKNVGLTQAGSAITTLLKYIKTDLSSTEILSLAGEGITDKWYNYEIISNCFPDEEDRLDYRGYAWVWIVDFPDAAQKMQQTIYGTTNISLKEDRVSAIDIMRSSRNTGAAHP